MRINKQGYQIEQIEEAYKLFPNDADRIKKAIKDYCSTIHNLHVVPEGSRYGMKSIEIDKEQYTPHKACELYPNDRDRIEAAVEKYEKECEKEPEENESYDYSKHYDDTRDNMRSGRVETKIKGIRAEFHIRYAETPSNKLDIRDYDVEAAFNKYDPALSSVSQEKLAQFERVYKKLANELVYDAKAVHEYWEKNHILLIRETYISQLEVSAAFTERTKRGVCGTFACLLSKELDKIGINNWLLDMDLKGHYSDHAANLIELDKGKLVVSDLVLDVAYAASPSMKRIDDKRFEQHAIKARQASANPTPYWKYSRYMSKERPLSKTNPSAASVISFVSYENGAPIMKPLDANRRATGFRDGTPMKTFREMYAKIQENPEKFSELRGLYLGSVKVAEPEDAEIKLEMEISRKLSKASTEESKAKANLRDIEEEIREAPVLTFALQTKLLEARVEQCKTYAKWWELRIQQDPLLKAPWEKDRDATIVRAEQNRVREAQAKLQEHLAKKENAETSIETPAKKPEKTPEREPAPDKQPDGIQKNIRKPSDNLREIKYLETRVKYFEMRIKYLEEPADREYNAAQLCEVQAKLRELQAGAPQDNSAERNSAERKAAERKAANTKKAAD